MSPGWYVPAKAETVRRELRRDPGRPNQEIAAIAGCHPSWVSRIRRKLEAVAPEPESAVLPPLAPVAARQDGAVTFPVAVAVEGNWR